MESASQPQRGARRRPGRPRGSSSRAGRPSSITGTHHPSSSSPASLTSMINFLGPPSTTPARPPARTSTSSRGRAAHPPHMSRSSADSPPAQPPAMDVDDHAAAPRPDRAPSQSPNLSFSVPTAQNPRTTPARKRACTLEDPAGHPDGEHDAKVKGGHALRKRARIDYAQMNYENEDDQQPYKQADQGRTGITVSGARITRKRRLTMDPYHDQEDVDQHLAIPPAKRARPDRQKTVSPKPSRRKTQRRKSMSAASRSAADPSLQHPSDTELKDTIEVGAPPLMHFTALSSSQMPASAANTSAQSPSPPRNSLPQQALAANAQISPPTAVPKKAGAATDTSTSKKPDQSPGPATHPPHSNHSSGATVPGMAHNGINGTDNTEKKPVSAAAPHDLVQQLISTRSVMPEMHQESSFPVRSSRHQESDIFETRQIATASIRDPLQGPNPPASQESTDSDATQDMPPDGPGGESVLAIKPRNTISPIPDEQRQDKTTKVPASSPPGTPALETRKEESKDHQDTSHQPLPRTRRRLGRLAETPKTAAQDAAPSPKSKKKTASADSKADQTKSANTASGISTLSLTPIRSDTPEKRRPGRPPKIRQSVEQESRQPPCQRRATAATRLTEQPRPIRAQTPRDFSYLTPYKDAHDVYPEANKDSGVPTPADTPAFQPSDAPGEQAEDADSLIPERESGTQDRAQPQPDGDAESNPPTPTAASDMPTPAAESVAPSRNATPEPVVESMRKPKARKQYAYPRIRSPNEFVNILEDFKTMSTEDLFNVLDASANALRAWQDEWKRQRLITEDEDNAVRRRAHDAALMAREARDMAKTNGTISAEKRDFEIKGIRSETIEENRLKHPGGNLEAYERNQDQIAAHAYGFEWDPRPSMIGKQDPLAQRDGLQNSRLRNRPKLSQRAAEAAGDDPAGVITGKRTRKPRVLSDESQEPSRAPTPVEVARPKQTRRRQKKSEAELFEGDDEAADSIHKRGQQAEETKASVLEQPVKKRRGPVPGAKKAAREAAAREAAAREAAARAAAAAAERKEVNGKQAADIRDRGLHASGAEQPKPRMRRRTAGATDPPPVAPCEDGPKECLVDKSISSGGADAPAPKSQRNRRTAATATKVEIPPSTFYGTTSSARNCNTTASPVEEFRPSTSSSISSRRTEESNYSLRTRTKKNYSDLADPMKEMLAEPRPKRGRKAKKEEEAESTSAQSVPAPAQLDGSSFVPPYEGYRQHQASPSAVLAPPKNPFINLTSSGPGPLLAPAPVRAGRAAPTPHPVGAQNPFSAPHNSAPVDPPPPIDRLQSPRKKRTRIKIINRRGQTATPQPTGPTPPQSLAPPVGHHAPLAPLQMPPNFHGHTGYESSYGSVSRAPHSMPGAGPGQFSFPVNSSHTAASSLQEKMPNHAPPPLTVASRQGNGSASLPSTSNKGNSKAPGSGRATPAASSTESTNEAGVQGEDLSEKDYASMTKSEKMSASMKARWANGSMRQAVNKRKETLARKKQKQSDERTSGPKSTPTPQPEQAPKQKQTTTRPSLPPPTSTQRLNKPCDGNMFQTILGSEYGGNPRHGAAGYSERQMQVYMGDGLAAPQEHRRGHRIWESPTEPYDVPVDGGGMKDMNGDKQDISLRRWSASKSTG